MLSYQHLYHAGNRADIHKHDILCRVLQSLCGGAAISCIETHAGRGAYDLHAPEAIKTGEADEGWLKLIQDKTALEKLSSPYIEAVQSLNTGKLSPLYPGSPVLAAHILRPQDKLYLCELHPAEYDALKKNMGGDQRIQIQKRDGIEFALTFPFGAPSLVLIDPSYEVKSEYVGIPDIVRNLHKKFPKAVILIWAPMLKADRHENMVQTIQGILPQVAVSKVTWADPAAVRGMYGSIMMGINADAVFKSTDPSFIKNL